MDFIQKFKYNGQMKMIIFAVFIFSFSQITWSQDSLELKPFVTDYCTMFVDGTPKDPTLWRHCCIMHDMKYWFGGSQNDIDRADLALKSCVEKVAGKNWAEIIYSGVRFGHHSPIKHKYIWSWGWTIKRPRIKLSENEKNYVIDELLKLPFDISYIEEVIQESFPSN